MAITLKNATEFDRMSIKMFSINNKNLKFNLSDHFYEDISNCSMITESIKPSVVPISNYKSIFKKQGHERFRILSIESRRSSSYTISYISKRLENNNKMDSKVHVIYCKGKFKRIRRYLL